MIAALLFIIVSAAGYLWFSHSGSTSKGVLILTPEAQNYRVATTGTITIGVAAQGDTGDGLVFTVAENDGGQVEPAGVSLRGQQIVFNAAYHAPSNPGIYHVVATSKVNRAASVTIAVRVRR